MVIEKVLKLNKRPGETPLECLERFRAAHVEYKDVAMSYVGRLDPLAEGLLVVVVGEENKNRLDYLGFPKEYEIEVLCGVGTDTGDPLGLVQSVSIPQENPEEQVRSSLPSFLGSYLEQYPPYSSRTVEGKPLHEWAREGRLGEIKIPEHKVTFFSLESMGFYILTKQKLLALVDKKIGSVNGDFRQAECLASWQESLKVPEPDQSFYVIKISAYVGSGAYMRILAQNIGKKAGFPALALHIKRLSVGEYRLDSSTP